MRRDKANINGSLPSVIDISHHQGFPDFRKIKEAGVLGVILKATQDTNYVDPNRRQNYNAAVAAGLRCCCYHYLDPGFGDQQAQFFLDTVQPVAGERVVLDYEEPGCTLDTLKDAVACLLDRGKNLQITIYSGHLLKEELGDTHDEFLAKHTDLWLAQYTSDFDTISWPDGTYKQWTLHQYTDKGVMPGVSGNCDLDRFNGSDAQLIDWLSPRIITPPTPEPGPRVVVDIHAPDGVGLEITVNGEAVVLEDAL